MMTGAVLAERTSDPPLDADEYVGAPRYATDPTDLILASDGDGVLRVRIRDLQVIGRQVKAAAVDGLTVDVSESDSIGPRDGGGLIRYDHSSGALIAVNTTAAVSPRSQVWVSPDQARIAVIDAVTS